MTINKNTLYNCIKFNEQKSQRVVTLLYKNWYLQCLFYFTLVTEIKQQ